MIKHYATPEGTKAYAKRIHSVHTSHFRHPFDLFLSSIGIGTYLGEMDEETDQNSFLAIERSILNGVNVIDTAINYRGQRSERMIGKVLSDLTQHRGFKREELFIATKGGFIPFDGEYPQEPAKFFSKTYVEPGILKEEDIIQGCHAMTPRYLADQLERSLKNLNLETVDLYYIHNPEMQLDETAEDLFYQRLTEAFKMLEQKVSDGKIKMYGLATWNGFRVSSKMKGHLNFEKIMESTLEAGGKDHHFKSVQLPFNLGMPEAFTLQNQNWKGEDVSAIEFARRAGLIVFSSASLLQGRLAKHVPEKIKSLFPGCSSQAACALQFVRSTPGVTTALVGMKSVTHVDENLKIKEVPPLEPNAFYNLFVERP